MKKNGFTRQFRVRPGKKVRLSDYDSDWKGVDEWVDLAGPRIDLEGHDLKEKAAQILEKSRQGLFEAQQRLYAQDTYSILVVLQAMDAGGKDGIIKHVFSGINPEGCQVVSFKVPSAEELDHNFLWRISNSLPERGRIGIFNRSHYEEVLVVKIHPKILEGQKLPPGKRSQKFWRQRYQDINAFERHLARNGTVIVKFFLYISKDEQKKRFMERLDNPSKNWKFSLGDVDERGFWDEYMQAFEQAISATSTKWAPWYIIPANHKWIARTLVATILEERIRELRLNYPVISPLKEQQQATFQSQLLDEIAAEEAQASEQAAG
jgi:PPK2 family polyphosphate:nucleotide phosphotransferase